MCGLSLDEWRIHDAPLGCILHVGGGGPTGQTVELGPATARELRGRRGRDRFSLRRPGGGGHFAMSRIARRLDRRTVDDARPAPGACPPSPPRPPPPPPPTPLRHPRTAPYPSH